MKNKLLHFCIIITYFFVLSSGSYPQSKNINNLCGIGKITTCSLDSSAVTNIPKVTPGINEFLRTLIIYVVFPDDTLSKYPYSIWDKPSIQFPSTKPVNPYSGTEGKLIWQALGNKTKIMDRYPDYTISDFFCEMSTGNMDIIGDEYKILLPYSSNYFDSTLHFTAGDMNAFVLHQLDSMYNIDWTRYDNWSFKNGHWLFSEQDTVPELIIMNYRTIPNGDWFWPSAYGGMPDLLLKQEISFLNIRIKWNNGITVLNNRYNTTHAELLIEHEICHKIFGKNIIGPDGWHVNLGMITASATTSTYTMSPYERTFVSSYVPSPYYINSPGVYIMNLGDYISTGQILNIYVEETDDNYYITNNQKISKYDGVARGGKQCVQINYAEQDPYCPDGKGLFIWRHGTGCYNVNYPFEIISAEGKFNWSIFRWVYVPVQNYHTSFGCELPIFKYNSSNNINGRDTYEKAPATESAYGQYLNYDDCSDNSNEFSITFDLYGTGKTGFNMNYNEIFSPYSNPSSNTCKNPTSTGLTIRLLNKDTITGLMQLKIYYNKNDSALLECPPAKPKTPVIDKHFIVPRIAFHPLISWEANYEPDLIDNGHYKIYRYISANCYEESEYSYLTSVSSIENSFDDTSLLLYVEPQENKNLPERKLTASYKIIAVDKNNMESVLSERGIIFGYNDNLVFTSGDTNIIPKSFALYQNAPNPFNSSTRIKYDIPKEGFVTLKIYDILGREIETLINEYKSSGKYSVDFNNYNVSSGIYFYRLQIDNYSTVKTMVIIK